MIGVYLEVLMTATVWPREKEMWGKDMEEYSRSWTQMLHRMA